MADVVAWEENGSVPLCGNTVGVRRTGFQTNGVVRPLWSSQ